MVADETPVQPDDCPWPVGTVLTSTGESGTFRWIFEHHVNGAWYEMGSEQRFTWADVVTFPNLTEMVARSAAVADQAGEPLDVDAIRTQVAQIGKVLADTIDCTDRHEDPDHHEAGLISALAVAELVMAALLAGVERLTRSEADLRESIGARAIDDAHAEREEIAGELAEAGGNLVRANVEISNAYHQRDEARAERDTAERERDEARAKVDGGEWVIEYGHSAAPGPAEWWDRHPCVNPRCMRTTRRVWIGPPETPVEAVGGDGSGT